MEVELLIEIKHLREQNDALRKTLVEKNNIIENLIAKSDKIAKIQRILHDEPID